MDTEADYHARNEIIAKMEMLQNKFDMGDMSRVDYTREYGVLSRKLLADEVPK